MYKHIFLPTDGSALSQRAIAAGIRLAKTVGARVTGLYVVPSLQIEPLEEWAHGDMRRLEGMFAKQAEKHLSVISDAAREVGVPCECRYVKGAAPFSEIIKAATERGCDLIFMASHGKGGLTDRLLGSETMKVLTYCEIPVLVHR
jgi:nucleotide-binding universal stress UspA family protein